MLWRTDRWATTLPLPRPEERAEDQRIYRAHLPWRGLWSVGLLDAHRGQRDELTVVHNLEDRSRGGGGGGNPGAARDQLCENHRRHRPPMAR